jgi:hypothetical protein
MVTELEEEVNHHFRLFIQCDGGEEGGAAGCRDLAAAGSSGIRRVTLKLWFVILRFIDG